MSEREPKVTTEEVTETLAQVQSEAEESTEFKIVHPNLEERKAQLRQITSQLEMALTPAITSGTVGDVEWPYYMSEAGIAFINAFADESRQEFTSPQQGVTRVGYRPLKLGLYLRQTETFDQQGHPSLVDYAIVGSNKHPKK